MARLLGVDIPNEKRIEIAITYIYGIGPTRAREILEKTGIDPNVRVQNLSDEQANTLTAIIQNDYKVEGDLRREVTANVKRLMDINCYRGLRHKRSLPVRGQRTHTNARTRKGPRKAAVKKK